MESNRGVCSYRLKVMANLANGWTPGATPDSGRGCLAPLDSSRPFKLGSPQSIRCFPPQSACSAGVSRTEACKQTDKLTATTSPKKKGSNRKRPALTLGSWNVRTMLTGLTTDIRNTHGLRKTAIISKQLDRLNVDIAALQETRLAGSGSLKEKYYTFFWHGKGEDEPREHGVGFAIRNDLIHLVEPGPPISERLMLMKLNSEEGIANLLSVYAPTLSSSSDVKDGCGIAG